MIVHLDQSGLHIDSSFVPDGSVGIHSSKHWTDNSLTTKLSTITPIISRKLNLTHKSLGAIHKWPLVSFVGGYGRIMLEVVNSRNT